MWIFFSDLVLEIENENYNVSIQNKYHPSHAPLEGNFNPSCTQFESNDHNEFKDEHEDFIQCNHDKNVAANYQIEQPVYIKAQEQCLNWMNINIGKSRHFMSEFYDIDCFFEAEFNEEDIFQA